MHIEDIFELADDNSISVRVRDRLLSAAKMQFEDQYLKIKTKGENLLLKYGLTKYIVEPLNKDGSGSKLMAVKRLRNTKGPEYTLMECKKMIEAYMQDAFGFTHYEQT